MFYRLDVTTNNPAVQVYTGYWLNTPRKKVHGGPSLNYSKWSAVAIEQEGYIDAINTPEWGVDQICSYHVMQPEIVKSDIRSVHRLPREGLQLECDL